MSHENFPCTCAVQFLHLQIFLIFLLSHVVAAYSHQLERVKKEWRKLQNLHFDLHILPSNFTPSNLSYLSALTRHCRLFTSTRESKEWVTKTTKSSLRLPHTSHNYWWYSYSFWNRLRNFLHKFTWIVLSVYKLNKLGKFW